MLARKAALFVDGRYILAAPQQVDTKLFSVLNGMETPPSQWLATQAKSGQEIGIDPRLHSETVVKAYRDRLAAKGHGWYRSRTIRSMRYGQTARPCPKLR